MLKNTNNYQELAKKEVTVLTEELKHDREKRLHKWNKALEFMKEVNRQRENLNYSF